MYDELMVNKNADIFYLQTSEVAADVLSKPVCGAQFSSLQRASRERRTHRFSSHKTNKKRIKRQVSTMAESPYEGRGALYFELYDVHMYETYVILVGVMSVCWSRKKNLTAGALVLTIGEQLCRRAGYPHKRNTRIEEREVSR